MADPTLNPQFTSETSGELFRILIVDDETENISALRRLLRNKFEIFSAVSGEEALRVFNQNPSIELVVCDQRMPGLQGSEVLEKIKDRDENVTRILLTGYSEMEALTEAINKGEIWRYVSKPWEPELLPSLLIEGAEKCRLKRLLYKTQHELQLRVTDLEAKRWANSRLVSLLRHEFRTVPQVLEGALELARDLVGPNKEDLVSFINRLNQRFRLLDEELGEFEAEGELPQIQKLQSGKVGSIVESAFGNAKIDFQNSDLKEATVYFVEGVTNHHLKLIASILPQTDTPTEFKILVQKSSLYPPSQLKIQFVLEPNSHQKISSSLFFPSALKASMKDPQVAWRALFEPFVGGEDLLNHSKGLRLDLAKAVRHFAKLGWKPQLRVDTKALHVVFELTLEYS